MSQNTTRPKMEDTNSREEFEMHPDREPQPGDDISVNLSTVRKSTVIRLADFVTKPNAWARIGWRLFDLAAAVSIAVAVSPLIILIALIIRASGSPVIFSHERVGRGRKRFMCHKFRTMVPDAQEVLETMLRSDPAILREWEMNHKLKVDPRVTPFGDFLRRSSLDELPQLWNVIRGDMSIVGPRPVVQDELKRYGNKALFYLSVRPGMTGLWQIMGRSNVTYSRRVDLDVRYVRNKSIRLDIWILIKTLGVVVKRVGAH